MAYQSDGIDPGASPTLGVFNDATVSGHIQGVKLIDATAGSTTPVGTSGNPLWTQSSAAGLAATTGYHAVSASSNNAAVIKDSSGSLVAVHVFNEAIYPVYVKFYNKATTPSPASDTPIATVGVQAGLPRDVTFRLSALTNGLGIAIVKNIADNDNTAIIAGDCVVDVEYL